MRCAVVVADTLPAGLAANAAAVLAATLGARVEGLVGADVRDAAGVGHLGLVSVPLPILRHHPAGIAEIAAAARADDEVLMVSFSALAQACRTYDEYIDRMAATATDALDLAGVALCGPRRRVTRLVGALALFT